MKTLYEKMRDNRSKVLRREEIRRQQEKDYRDKLAMARMALGVRLSDAYHEGMRTSPEICKPSKI